ncbi:MAG: chemotaxis response regulator protein-glutamate methylesterase [Bacteroidetes bacterium]|nr:chemotaxis response regulator protein-glutamate methylesterase [Bacteroidota bacterium]
MRKALSSMLDSDPEIRVVGVARDGQEGLEKICRLRPDVVTLDVEMPGMDGLSALRVIMRDHPVPVLMVSSLTTEGAQATMEALDLGAVDFISKEMSFVSVGILQIRNELIAKVREIATSRYIRLRFETLRQRQQPVKTAPARRAPLPVSIPSSGLSAVAVGVSTGGPLALLQMIPQLPASFPLPMVVVQHMPPHFTQTMSQRLNSVSAVAVKEAATGDRLSAGSVYVAPGGRHLTFERDRDDIVVVVSDEPRTTLYRPSADVMMLSLAAVAPRPVVGLIMTGMGKDGLNGLRSIKHRGGIILAQDEASCVVYGMPRAAVDDGLADAVLSLDEIPSALVGVAQRAARPALMHQQTTHDHTT